MTVDEVIKRLESDGWRQTNDDESCRQFKHDSKAKTVTICGKLETVIPVGGLRSLHRYAELAEET